MSGTPTFPEIDYLCNWSNPKTSGNGHKVKRNPLRSQPSNQPIPRQFPGSASPPENCHRKFLLYD